MKTILLDTLQFGLVSRATRRLLVFLFSIAVLMRIVFALVTPHYLDEAGGNLRPFNDEYPHLKYSLYLIEHHRFPINTQVRNLEDPVVWIFNEFEYAQPPLFYVLNIPFTLFPDAMLASRCFAVLLSTITLLLAVSSSIILFRRKDPAAVAMMVFLGYNPILLRIGSSVSNDNLAWLLSMILFYLYVRGKVWEYKWVTGIVLGFGLLTKFSFMIWVFFLLFYGVGSADRKITTLRLKTLGFVLLMALVMSGWWYVRNYFIYGEWTGIFGGSGPPGSYLMSGSLDYLQKFVTSALRFTFFPVAEEAAHNLKVIEGIVIFFFASFFLQYQTIREEFLSNSVFKGFCLFNAMNLLLFLQANLRYHFSETRLLFMGLFPLSSILVTCLIRNFGRGGGVAAALINSIYLISLW